MTIIDTTAMRERAQTLLDGTTPGSWFVSPDSDELLIVSETNWFDEHGKKRRDLTYANVVGSAVESWQGASNAHLIAAAPDLAAESLRLCDEVDRLKSALSHATEALLKIHYDLDVGLETPIGRVANWYVEANKALNGDIDD